MKGDNKAAAAAAGGGGAVADELQCGLLPAGDVTVWEGRHSRVISVSHDAAATHTNRRSNDNNSLPPVAD